MRSFKTLGIAALVTIAAFGVSAFIKPNHTKKIKAANKGFAVIELFTSEGCSSCPPADALVARVEKENKDQPVYILAYHVDYWNSLGWKDAFSSADYSKRQTAYAHYLHLPQIYTPQIVVNGKTEFVGSEESTLRSAIKTSLQKESTVQFSLNITSISKGHADLKYATAGTDKNAVLQVAIVQKNAETKVERGENAGHTLSHVQIVRKLQSVSLSGNSGTVNVSLPNGFDPKEWEIVGILQNSSNGAITAAARAEGMPAAI